METLQAGSDDLLAGLHRFQGVLGALQITHERLEQRAKRMEAELEVSNQQLAAKVAELDRTNQFLEAILSSLPSGVVVRNAEDQIVRVNAACLSILDCSASELLGSTDHLPLLEHEQNDAWNELITAQGVRKIVVLNQSAVQDSKGQDLGSVQILSDQTALASATAQVHQQSKMAALGTMAGGIAHEIRNPMNAVRGFAGLLARPGVSPEAQRRYASAIERGVIEVESTIHGLLNLANPSGPEHESLSSQGLLTSALDLVQAHESCADIAWTTDIEDQPFAGDRVQLRQALRNLIANAVQAQHGQGAIHVVARSTDDAVVFEVHDAGPGLASQPAERWIDPFYTTRAEGMGLGLSLVDRIARLHGGSLQISPTPSVLGGACVRLSLPLS